MEENFQFAAGDVVLAEWTDKLFYAKILHIDRAQLTCTLLFDDDSVEECPISKIHSVTETTADIVCIICKDGSSCSPNVIVLCDKCGVGYHQKCHEPFIKDNALEPDAPWMCVYCSNGTDCPYLLNPFEAKMKHFTPGSRKQRGIMKDNPYSSDPKADFGNNNRSESARARMEGYYNDNNRHSELSTGTSSVARHILGDRHAVSRRGIVDHRLPGHHGNRFYKFPKSYEASRERLHFRQMESDAKRRRVGEQEKKNTTQDVWDNGCVPEKVEPKNKALGKEGPREKQRLTQDLERQRKKLKEDMERGQVLKREHSQLLTRDHGQVKNNIASKEGLKGDLEEAQRQARTLYYPGQEWPGTYLAGNSSGRNPREKTESNEMSCDDTRVGKKRNCNLNETASLQQTKPTTELDKKEPRIQLDACGCTGTENHSGGSQREETAKNNLDGTKEGVVEESSETQCEHSMSSRNPHTGETIEFTYESISPPSSNARGDVMVEPREELMCGTGENINGVHERAFTSEKVEVIGRSDDLTSSSNHEKGRQYPRGRPKKTQGKAANRPYKKCPKSLPEKDNYENTSEGTDAGFHENRPASKTKEGNGNVEGSGGFQRQSVSHSDNEVADTEEGESKERVKTISHNATHEGGNKNVDEVQNVITQNRVRSDLPRHNWLIERLRNEKKLPPGGSRDGGLKEKKATSEDVRVDSKSEVTSSTRPANAELKKLPTGHVPEEKPKEGDVDDVTESSCEEETRYSEDKELGCENGDEPGSPNFKILSPKSERNSPANSLSPELKRYSPILPPPPASPREEEQELQKGSSPLLKVLEVPEIILGEKRQSLSRESVKDDEIVVEDNFLLDSLEGRDKTTTRNERQSVEEIEEDNLQILVDEKEKAERTEDEKIIEIKSDGEGHEDIKQSNDTNKERELQKIPTGKSVNPVSPFQRSERRSTEELKPGSHGSHHHGVVPRSPRFPVDLSSALPFMKPGYIPGYPPRTFTPHLITHNTGLSAVSQMPGHAGHLPTRLDLSGHSKSDHNCPYHGKKATDKLTQHAPGYPMIHSDHHHLGRIPFHEGVPDFALQEKIREHVQLASDPTAFHRRLPSLYDNHRHFMMPHGMPGHMFPTGYLPPHLLDEHMLHLDRERFERRTFPLHEPLKYAYNGPSGEHQNAPKCVASPGPEKRNASKHAASPSAEHRNVPKHVAPSSCDGEREPTKTKHLHETTAGHYHSGHHPDMLLATRQRSPHELKYSSHSELNAMLKSGNHSPFAIAHPAYTPPPPGNETSDHRSSFIQLGETKATQVMTGSERNSLGPSASAAAHDQESIRRDFQEKLNKLNTKFIQGLDAMDKPGDERSYKTLDNVPPSGYRKPGAEFLHRGVPMGYLADGITRPQVGENASALSRETGKLKYSNHDNRRTAGARSSSPGGDRGEPDKRGFFTVSAHKPTLPTTSYRPHGNTAGLPRPHGVQFRDDMKVKPPGMMHGLPHLTRHGEHPVYHDHVPWAVRQHRPMAGYPITRINPEAHQKTAMEKSEKDKVEHIPSKQELDEKEINLAREKHLINLTHLENERRKAMMGNIASQPRLPSRSDERPKEERTRPDKAEQGHLSPKAREDALHWDWEEAESRKRKYEDIRPEILAMHGRISPFGKTSSDQNKRLKSAPADGRIPSHNLLHQHIHEDFNSRKDRFLSMYPRSDPYGHVTTVPYAGRGRDVGNAPFYMGRFDLQRPKPEQGMELRKQREVTEGKISVEKQSSEKERSTSEPAKKRPKPQKLCDVCRKEASFLCSGCEKAWYCSTECQFKAWTEHSKECSQGKRR